MIKINPKPEPRTYPVICAWCKCTTGQSTVEGSHGICHECAERLKAEAWLEKSFNSTDLGKSEKRPGGEKCRVT